MAGEIQEHFRLDFKSDSLHSGSISFGRFESESLCWERRSSFSHNRHLEEVEKCSKPGSVIEKKAYFEAHFRKKGGIFGLSLPERRNETEYQISDHERSEKTVYDEEISHVYGETHSSRFDESLDGSLHSEHEVMQQESEFGSSDLDSQIEFSCDGANNVDDISEHVKVEEAHQAILESAIPARSRSEIEVKEKLDGEAVKLDKSNVSNVTTGLFDDHYATEENSDASCKGQQGSSSKEENSSQAEYRKPRSVCHVSVSQSRKYISNNKATKDLEKNPSKTVNNVLMSSKSEKNTSGASSQGKCPVHKTPKHEPAKKANGVDEIKRGEKESKNRGTEVSRSSTLRKLPSKVRQNENRIKPTVGVTQPCIKQESSGYSFKCNERAERRKEFDLKSEEKMQAKKAATRQLQAKTRVKSGAEIKQLRGSLNFKATPLPSFYRGVLRESDRNKAIASNVEPRKGQIKSSRTGSRVSESCRLSSKSSKDEAVIISAPQESRARSCHSTVTSDSSSSSPAAESSKRHHSQAVGSSWVGWEKEKEKDKLTCLPKHKAPEGNKICRGKIMDGKQTKRTEA